ncbi:MAG TPA: protein translocase subunit SecF [Steroidobacteraceae bacterium]|nr:protein translocase subunit SecF [Steroidobacteraceae bacterium]
MEFFHKVTTFPFMHTRRRWYAVSAVAIIASAILLATRGLNLGIDFTGGVEVEFSYPHAADLAKAREALEKAGFEKAEVSTIGSPNDVLVRLPPQEHADVKAIGASVTTALQSVAPDVELRRSDLRGAQIGDELKNQGVSAVMLTFLLVGVYTWFRFQWKMGLSAVVATLHDPIIILGFFAAMRDYLVFDLSVLAAVLAVIGYSLNDTVVVFDRVRDNFHSMRRSTPEEVLDASINQTLSRTIITSGATLLVVIVLLIFGGETLKGFSWALTMGILVGTYSSIYVAGAMSLELGLCARDLMPPQDDKEKVDALP